MELFITHPFRDFFVFVFVLCPYIFVYFILFFKMLSLNLPSINTVDKYNYYNLYGYKFETVLDVMTSESEIHIVKSIVSEESFISKVYNIYGNTEEEITKYMTEVYIMKKLENNNNIVKIIDFIRHNELLSFVFELCNQGDLYTDILTRKMNNQMYTEAEILNIFEQMLNGLKSIHNNNIVHADLKSTNIFINNGQIKIGDFGISQIGNNNNLGTVNCLSYESIKLGMTTKLSDLFQIGCIMYELVTLSSPFLTNEISGMINIFENTDYQKNIIKNIPSIYSDKITTIISKLLSLNTLERYEIIAQY